MTGGAHGIGKATCSLAEDRGHTPVVFDLEPVAGRHGYVVDVADPGAVTRAVELAWRDHGPVHGLVNNAGVVWRTPLLQTTPADFARVLAVNLVGAYACLQAVAARWVREGQKGNVVNVSSAHAVLAQADRSAYAASKAGLESLTRSAALELGPLGIGVFGLAAGYTRTEPGRTRLEGERAQAAGRRVPLGRVIEAEEVAAALLDLVECRYPAMAGQVLRLDGGWSATDVRLEDLV